MMEKGPSRVSGLRISRMMVKRWSRWFWSQTDLERKPSSVTYNLEPITSPLNLQGTGSALLSAMKPSLTAPRPDSGTPLGFAISALPTLGCHCLEKKSVFSLECTLMEARLGLSEPLLGPQYCPSQSQAMYSITVIIFTEHLLCAMYHFKSFACDPVIILRLAQGHPTAQGQS